MITCFIFTPMITSEAGYLFMFIAPLDILFCEWSATTFWLDCLSFFEEFERGEMFSFFYLLLDIH